jgi:hypothetical protein
MHELVAEDAIHLSTNDHSPELERVLPWARRNRGPQGFLDVHSRMFHDIRHEFISKTIFGSGGNVARSRSLMPVALSSLKGWRVCKTARFSNERPIMQECLPRMVHSVNVATPCSPPARQLGSRR